MAIKDLRTYLDAHEELVRLLHRQGEFAEWEVALIEGAGFRLVEGKEAGVSSSPSPPPHGEEAKA